MSGRDPKTSQTVLTERGDKDLGDSVWKSKLSETVFKVLRRKCTEPRKIGKSKGGFDDIYDEGTYLCGACETPLYLSTMKFDCGCGWPGFWTNIQGAVAETADADGQRVELTCSACRSHLGHVFRGENFNNPPPNERHCINSCSLSFLPKGSSTPIKCTYDGKVFGDN